MFSSEVIPLLPLPNQRTITVVSWVSPKGLEQIFDKPDLNICDVDRQIVTKKPIWVNLSDEIQSKCQFWGLKGNALRLRLEQLIGLPPNQPDYYRKKLFVVAEVVADSYGKVFRPCFGIDTSDPLSPVCTLDVKKETLKRVHDFVCQQLFSSHIANGLQMDVSTLLLG